MPSVANGRTSRERVLSRLIINPETGCLLWTGYTDKKGYGIVHVDGRLRKVHQVMHEWFIGPIPDGLVSDHLCRVRHCAAPSHLEAVTSWVNTMRGETPAAFNAAKTHCPAGHEYNEANTYWHQGRRHCRPCHSQVTNAASRRIHAGREASDGE